MSTSTSTLNNNTTTTMATPVIDLPSAVSAALAGQPEMPAMANASDMVSRGFADVAGIPLSSTTLTFAQWLLDSSAACGTPIDAVQGVKFLTHMIRTMGLGNEDLVYMKVFISRYQRSFATSPTERQEGMTSFGLQLLLSAYCAQSLQYDEPLAKDTWLLYARMPWADFLDNLFAFNSAFGFDLSVSVSEWNTAAWSLAPASSPTVVPVQTPRPVVRLPVVGGVSKKSTSSKKIQNIGSKIASGSSDSATKIALSVANEEHVGPMSHSPRVPSSSH